MTDQISNAEVMQAYQHILDTFHRIGKDLEERDKQWQVALAAMMWHLAEEFPEKFKDETGKARNLVEEFLAKVYHHQVKDQKANDDTIIFSTEPPDGKQNG